MASIRNEIAVRASPVRVWDAVRDFGAVDRRVAPGFLTGSKLHGGNVRVTTFGNGAVAREALVSSDDENRRLVYAMMDLRFTQYSASVQACAEGEGSRVIW